MSELVSRRRLLQAAAVLGASAVVAQAGEEKPSTKDFFAGEQFKLAKPDGLNEKAFSSNISQDGLAVTLLLGSANIDALRVALGETDKLLSTVKIATFHIPFVLPRGKRLIGFTQDIRGFVQKSKGTRLALIADLGGTAQVFEFPYDQESTGENFQRSFFSVDRRQADQEDLTTPYTINCFLTLQRRTAKDVGHLVIDSLDMEAILYNPDVPKRNPTPYKERPKKP